MNAVKEDIPALIEKELAAANVVYPLFADRIHAHGVIREELEEARECLQRAEVFLGLIWDQSRKNEPLDESIRLARAIEEYGIRMAEESIQVAAMARKAVISLSNIREG